MSDKKVIIACYNFPPNPGIGGRRWAKFAKFLAKHGWEVHTISCEPSSEETSSWEDDVKGQNIHRHTLAPNHPTPPKKDASVLQRILYKLIIKWYQTSQSKRVSDATFLWEKQYQNLLKEIIQKHSIKNVIVTGSPFYWLYYTASLKKKLGGNFNLITDFRDPWLNALNYGIQNLNTQQKKQEDKLLEEVLRQSDTITAPNKFMLTDMVEYFQNEGIIPDKFIELTHAYDRDDLNTYLSKAPKAKDSDKIKLIYGGALYMEIDPVFDNLNIALSNLQEKYPSLYQKLSIEIFTNSMSKHLVFTKHASVLQKKPSIGKKIFEKIKEADACLILLASHNKNFRTTKFFENLPFQKPYLVMGDHGFIADFVAQNQLGFHMRNDHFSADFQKALESLDNGNHNYNYNFEFDQFSFEAKTHQLESLLQHS